MAEQGTTKIETKVVVEKLAVPAQKVIIEQKPKAETKSEPTKEEPKKEVVDPNSAKEDIWMYHKDYEPKLFKKGEKIAEGFVLKNTFGWERDPKNNFIWKKK